MSLVPSLMQASHPLGAWDEFKGTQVSRKESEGAVPALSRALELPVGTPVGGAEPQKLTWSPSFQ